jgi:hypothetical protein
VDVRKGRQAEVSPKSEQSAGLADQSRSRILRSDREDRRVVLAQRFLETLKSVVGAPVGPAVVVAVVAQQEAAAAADIEGSIRWRERVEYRAAREVVYNDAPRRAGHRRAGSRCESS